jgi:uncharacterized protein YkwD
VRRRIVIAIAGILVACGTPPWARYADEDPSPPSAPPVTNAAKDGWVETTQSPWPSTGALSCGTGDAALERVAQRMVAERARGLGATDPDDVLGWMRENGAPHLRPRIVSASGKAPIADGPLTPKLEALRSDRSRCGIARAPLPHGGEIVAAVVVDALADLAPLPTHARTGAWLDVDATLAVAATDARVVILGPRGIPRAVTTSFDPASRRARARFVLDRPGPFTVQLVGDVESGGPRPLLEARVFADVAATSASVVPGEDTADPNDLETLVTRLREAESLPVLTRDRRLDAIATAHAARMLAARTTAHDVGEGDLRARFVEASLDARRIGENVAHAASVLAAHRALHASPSHRLELLRSDYTHLGIGIARADDGSVYVCEVFADGIPPT